MNDCWEYTTSLPNAMGWFGCQGWEAFAVDDNCVYYKRRIRIDEPRIKVVKNEEEVVGVPI